MAARWVCGVEVRHIKGLGCYAGLLAGFGESFMFRQLEEVGEPVYTCDLKSHTNSCRLIL